MRKAVISLMTLCALSLACPVNAQEGVSVFDVQTRVDASPSLQGKFLNVRISGRIDDRFSYGFRHRLPKLASSQDFFDATDWVWLDWKLNDRWSLNAGKQVVAIGGFEYDRAPIDHYLCSEYWNHIACYQFGVSASYRLTESDNLLFQVCQSPNRVVSPDMLAFNLLWNGSHGAWSTIWSANAVEAAPGSFLGYISLGNRLDSGPFYLEADVMHRAPLSHFGRFDDFSVMAEAGVHPCEEWKFFAKYAYDHNSLNDLDFCVARGIVMHSLAAGAEFFPAKGVRLHALALYRENFFFNCGLTFNIDLLKALNKTK